MASILTNTSAMVALQNLRTINNNLVDTQNQISTGKKISSATDNSLFLVSRTKQPHQKEEGHHSGYKICIGNFPSTAVVTAGDYLLALNDDWRFRVAGHR